MADGPEQWLQAGIAAARAGRRQEAEALLLQVVAADEDSVPAWLWLSGVVDSLADRRLCLENVLTLEPDHVAARRGLARLAAATPAAAEEGRSPATEDDAPAAEAAETAPPATGEIRVRKEVPPVSPAAAVLYPERQVREWRYRDPTLVRVTPALAMTAVSAYDDVWSRDDPICGFCAAVVDEADARCSGCGRRLWRATYRYERPSTDLHVLWVFLAAIGQLFVIQAIYRVVIEQVLWGSVIAGVAAVTFFVLAVGVYLRQAWAHWGSILALSGVLLSAVVGVLFPLDLSTLELRLAEFDPAITRVVAPLAGGLGDALQLFQIAAAILALYYAAFRAAADFEKLRTPLTAQLQKGLRHAGEFNDAARRAARRGQVATAVLHWQRAVAAEPHQVPYLRHLGLAYARLGFFERSLDVLGTARNLAADEAGQQQLDRLAAAVEKRQQLVEGGQE